MLLDQSRMEHIAQSGVSKLREGARESGSAGNLALTLPTTQAPQVRLQVEHLDQKVGGGQVVNGLGHESTSDVPSILARASPRRFLRRCRHMIFNTNDLQDSDELLEALGQGIV